MAAAFELASVFEVRASAGGGPTVVQRIDGTPIAHFFGPEGGARADRFIAFADLAQMVRRLERSLKQHVLDEANEKKLKHAMDLCPCWEHEITEAAALLGRVGLQVYP